jgi:hypothetical protein
VGKIHGGKSIANTNDTACAWFLGAKWHLAAETATIEDLSYCDTLVATMWKMQRPWESRWMGIVWEFKKKYSNKRLIIYQEGEVKWPTFLSWKEQKALYELLQVTDLFLAHNEKDAEFYKLLMQDEEKVLVFPTLQYLDLIKEFVLNPFDKDPKYVLTQNFDNRSNGLFASLLANKLGMSILHMNTSVWTDGRNEEAAELFNFSMTEIPQCAWIHWAKEVSKAYVYLHPLTVAGAGRDTIAAATLGVPVIGNQDLDAQIVLFPKLACSPYDLKHQKKLLIRLFEDEDFYSEVRNYGMRNIYNFDFPVGEQVAQEVHRRLECTI